MLLGERLGYLARRFQPRNILDLVEQIDRPRRRRHESCGCQERGGNVRRLNDRPGLHAVRGEEEFGMMDRPAICRLTDSIQARYDHHVRRARRDYRLARAMSLERASRGPICLTENDICRTIGEQPTDAIWVDAMNLSFEADAIAKRCHSCCPQAQRQLPRRICSAFSDDEGHAGRRPNLGGGGHQHLDALEYQTLGHAQHRGRLPPGADKGHTGSLAQAGPAGDGSR